MTKNIKLLVTFLLLSTIFNSNCIDFGAIAHRTSGAVVDWTQQGARAIGGWVNNHRMQMAVGSVSAAGIGTLINKYGKENVLIGAGLVGVTYAGNGIRHWWQLNSIENQLDKARKNDPNCFLYATWNESQWNTASDIMAQKKAVRTQLKQDAQAGAFSPGGARKKTLAQVRNAINTEKRQLEEWMRMVGGLTNVPKCILTISCSLNRGIHQSFINGITVQPDTEKVFKCVQQGMWYKVANPSLNAFKVQIDRNTSNSSSILHMPGWNPKSWAIAPCAVKATNLYWELFKAYVRLNALKTVVEEKDEADKGEQLLTEARSKLDEMIGAQPNAYRTSDNKQQQIVRLSAVQAKIKALQSHYKANNDILKKLTPIASQLSAINTSLLEHKVLSYPDLLTDDPIKGLLQGVKGMVDSLIGQIRD
jgi:hypothetical protein